MISVIVTTKNESRVIGDLLASIEKQTYKNYEIILVDNNSTDSTKKIAKKYTGKVFNKGPERSIQRNYGVNKSEGDHILILDADMVLEKNVLKECVSFFEKHKDFGALVIPEKSFGNGYWAAVRKFERELYEGDSDIEAARCFRRKLFLEHSGYDPEITGPEDADLPLRMKKDGVKIGRVKSYVLHNEKNFTPIKSARKKYYYARGSYKYLTKHPEMAMSQGNLIFRKSFFKNWRKLVSLPHLAVGLAVLKSVEMLGAVLGITVAIMSKK